MESKKHTVLVYGVGINDASYNVTTWKMVLIDGKMKNMLIDKCPFYFCWKGMLERCYSPSFHTKHPTYTTCSVVKEWLTFSNFKSWMEEQKWEGKELDKDLIIEGNKLYSPETCAFVDAATNVFITDSASARGDYPVGVVKVRNGKFRARCGNPITNKREHLGYFDCPVVAHNTWKTRKHEIAIMLSVQQDDPRVAAALQIKYK